MREIKFRQWIGGKFSHFGFNNDRGRGYTFMMPENLNIEKYPVQQFTGMVDEFGTEIYEGDIIGFGDDSPQCNSGLYGSLGFVLFSEYEGRFNVLLNDGREVPLADHLLFRSRETCRKVYGNVFENPELIEI